MVHPSNATYTHYALSLNSPSGTSQSCWRTSLGDASQVNVICALGMILANRVPSLVEIWTSSTSTCFSVSVRGIFFLVETSFSVMVIFSFSARETFQTFVSEGFCRP